jgi:hypothetical protein
VRPSTAAEKTAAVQSIRKQLDAFKRGDFTEAVTYQSEALKRNFESTAAFQGMMERSYPQFVRWKTVRFGDARSDAAGDRVVVPAIVKGEDGRTVEAIYTMLREGDTYRVEGVAGGRPRRLEGEQTL